MNGPDESDVIVLMSAIETLHECRLELIVTAGGQAHNGTCTILLKAEWARLPESALPKSVATTATWPNNNGRSWWGEAMNMLYVLDFLIGESYQQRFLPSV
jgi:hypothetical protein